MSTTFIKRVGVALIVLIGFYGVRYVSTAIHVACQNPAEDCPPPIYLVGEFFYTVIVHPPWLSKISNNTEVYE